MDRNRIEKLQAQLAVMNAELESLKAEPEPEWVPFPGELIEVQETAADDWKIRVATGGKSLGEILAYDGGRNWGTPVAWLNARPLSDPNIIQLRPHTPGDPMPCGETHRVLYRMVSGGVAMSRIAQQAWWAIAPTPSEPPAYEDDDWLDEIEEEIWNSGVMLAEAITDADSKLTIEAAIRLHAEKIRENRRERGY